MYLIVSPVGTITALYTEVLDLSAIGPQRIQRASHVEPDGQGRWHASMINGPILGPFDRRSTAIDAEIQWLLRHRLGVSD